MPFPPISFNLVKQMTDLMDWLMRFPELLVDSIKKPRETYLYRKERIAKLKELVEIREITKTIFDIYITKGGLSNWVSALQNGRRDGDADELRAILESVATALDSLAHQVSESSISNLAIAAEAATHLTKGAGIYRELAACSDETLLSDKHLTKIAQDLDQLMEIARSTLDKVDAYRHELDSSYG